MSRIKTYNPKEVTITLGSHIVSGYAEDSFVSVEPAGDGITKKVGCSGEIVRSINPDDTYNVKITLLQTSESNAWLQDSFANDYSTGEGMWPILIKDLKGGLVFSSDNAWVVRSSPRQFGREAGSREWDIQTGAGTLTE